MHKIDFLTFFNQGLEKLQFQHRKILPCNIKQLKIVSQKVFDVPGTELYKIAYNVFNIFMNS